MARTVAINVVSSTRGVLTQQAQLEPSPYLQAYLALRELDHMGLLSFNLRESIEEVIAYWLEGAVDPTMETLLRQIEQGASGSFHRAVARSDSMLRSTDYPAINISPLAVRLEFLKAEKDGVKELEVIKARMGSHQGKRLRGSMRRAG